MKGYVYYVIFSQFPTKIFWSLLSPWRWS